VTVDTATTSHGAGRTSVRWTDGPNESGLYHFGMSDKVTVED